MDTYIYRLGGDTYINLTNECTNDCTFCLRQGREGVGGKRLWLEKEPTAAEVIGLLKVEQPGSVVFCGFGEPTVKIDELKEIAAYVKGYGGHVRVDTNGHANIFHGRNVVPELAGLVDEVSISLNETDAAEYAAITKSRYGEQGYHEMLSFARKCVRQGIAVTLSVVDVVSEETIAQAEKIAGEMGAKLRVRGYLK